MTPAAAGRPKKKFKFFKSKERRIPSPPPPPRIREEDFLSEEEVDAAPLTGIQERDFHSEEEEKAGDRREVLREAVVDRRGQAQQEAEELQNSLASEFRVENRRGAQDDGEFAAVTICRMYRQGHAPCRVISKLRCRSETLDPRDIFITYATYNQENFTAYTI